MKVSETFMRSPRRGLRRAPWAHIGRRRLRCLFDYGHAVLEPLLALDHDLLAGFEAGREGRNGSTRLGHLDGAALDRHVGLHNEHERPILARLDRHKWGRCDLGAEAEIYLDPHVLPRPEATVL